MSALDVLTMICATGSAVVAGVFFVFSVCVMRALGALPAPHGIAAMQSINIKIINPWFLTVFLGTAGTCLLAVATSIMLWGSAGAASALVGGLLYLVGGLFVTVRCNLPRNDALARVTPDSDAAARVWANYLSQWTFWNHVRTAASLGAALSFALPRWIS